MREMSQFWANGGQTTVHEFQERDDEDARPITPDELERFAQLPLDKRQAIEADGYLDGQPVSTGDSADRQRESSRRSSHRYYLMKKGQSQNEIVYR